MIFDTHTHYDDREFDGERDQVILKQLSSGVGKIIACAADMQSSLEAIEIAERYPDVYAAVGVHPDNIDGMDAGELLKIAAHSKCRAIGEIGLDYHWDVHPRELQIRGFVEQWRLAEELDLPVVIHSRDAAEDTLRIVREMYEEYSAKGKRLKADMHCYSYSPEQAAEYVRMGLYFGIGGVLTFKNSKKLAECVKIIPRDRILLETDCPYLAPEPYRGKRNESLNLKYVVAKLADILGISEEETEKITYENASVFFGVEI